MAKEAIYSAEPITAVLDHKNVLYIPYHPIGRDNTTRSSVDLMEIKFDDNEGTMIQNLCWVCPIQPTNNITHFASIHSIKSNFIKEFVLMLPTLNEDNGHDFTNNYIVLDIHGQNVTKKETLYQLQSIKIYFRIGMNMKSMTTMTKI